MFAGASYIRTKHRFLVLWKSFPYLIFVKTDLRVQWGYLTVVIKFLTKKPKSRGLDSSTLPSGQACWKTAPCAVGVQLLTHLSFSLPVFCVYYVTRGILQENRQELIVFVLSILLVMFRSVVNFTVLSAEQKPKLLVSLLQNWNLKPMCKDTAISPTFLRERQGNKRIQSARGFQSLLFAFRNNTT